MPSVTLKGIPDELLSALREAAEADRRSLNQEILHLLTVAVRRHPEGASTLRPEVESQLAAWRRIARDWEWDRDPEREAKALTARRSRGRKVDF